MQTETKYPLVPEDEKPEACRRLGCLMTIDKITTDAPIPDGIMFRHAYDGRVERYVIPMAWLDDVDKDIWGEISPWMASLHEDGPGLE